MLCCEEGLGRVVSRVSVVEGFYLDPNTLPRARCQSKIWGFRVVFRV